MKSCFFAVIFAFFPPLANATLIDQGSTTLDSNTNLMWLDITETVGMSYSEVLSSDFVTQDLFRFATMDELSALYNHAGGSGNYYVPRTSNGGVNGVPDGNNYTAARTLLDLMGCTSYIVGQQCDLAEQDWHIGFYGPEVINGIQTASVVDAFGERDYRNGKAAIWLDFAETVPSRTRRDFGSYLVRINPIPEPTGFWLFSAGLIILLRPKKSLNCCPRLHSEYPA
jgi:hypothetical protein